MDITGIGSAADLASNIIDKIWPDKSEQEKQQLSMALTMIQGQLTVNQTEAASNDRFKSGWRPFIGWTCGCACAWNWIGISVVKFILISLGMSTDGLAAASLTEMLPILIGMLGLGVYRTTEKLNGRS